MAFNPPPCHAAYELRFESLFDAGKALSFPCDGQGHVDLDGLSSRARENYLYARAVIGFEYRFPAVHLDPTH
jgi:hypothetical protein